MSRAAEARKLLQAGRSLAVHAGLEAALVAEMGELQAKVLEQNHDLAEERNRRQVLSLAIESFLAGKLDREALAYAWNEAMRE